mgnify:CR=1 FL=1
MIKAFEEDLVKKLGKEIYERVRKARVGIAGAGGLGSNCASSLARCGFRDFIIVDSDRIEASNLDRQFYFEDQIGMPKVDALKVNLLRINPAIEIRAVFERITDNNIALFFGACDIVAECLDAAESKSMLVAGCMRLGKIVVTASGLGGIGSSDNIKVTVIKDNLVMIGDQVSDISTKPAMSPRVAIAAAKQADIILERFTKTF